VRASGPTGAPAEPVKPVEAPAAKIPPSEAEPPKPAELIAEAAKPAEIAVDLEAAAATAAPSPSIGALSPAPKSAPFDDLDNLGHNAAEALGQSQAALARGLEALSAELGGSPFRG